MENQNVWGGVDFGLAVSFPGNLLPGDTQGTLVTEPSLLRQMLLRS